MERNAQCHLNQVLTQRAAVMNVFVYVYFVFMKCSPLPELFPVCLYVQGFPFSLNSHWDIFYSLSIHAGLNRMLETLQGKALAKSSTVYFMFKDIKDIR